MREPITDKRQMYEALAAGILGNTLPQYFDYGIWMSAADFGRYKHWGVRSILPGGPAFMYVPTVDVRTLLADLTEKHAAYNISPMIYGVTLMANIYTGTTGLYVHYVEYPTEGVTWREHFATPNTSHEAHGVAAYNILKRHLNPNGLDDVYELLQLYPDHVVEVSVTSDCIGTLPHRNYVTWEVRRY